MLNMIKMDLYRMFHTKALYVIWIILAAAVFFTTYMSKVDYAWIQEQAEVQEQTDANLIITDTSEETKNINIGMEVSIPTQPGEKITVFDQIYANLQGKFIALFLLIFTVLYSSADLGSGYIKNIGGQVKNRAGLILSKAAALFVFTILSMLLYLICQTICQGICFGSVEWGSIPDSIKYIGVQTCLHYALVLICMAIAVIVKYNVISMTLSVCLSMNIMIILYGFLDKLIQKTGVSDFHVIEHTVTGKIALLSMNADGKEIVLAIVTATVFAAVAAALTGIVFGRRDIA